MTMNNIIVGMGEALWDVLPEGRKLVVLGKLRLSCITIRFRQPCGQCDW
mgnify:CR=1 FL=1